MDPFTDSNLRLGRAQGQFNALQAEVQKWLQRRTYSFSIRRDAATRECIAEIGETEPLPATWAVIATEIVHHFRAALDNVIHALTISHSGQPMKGTEFPVFLDKKGFDGQGRVKMRGVSSACQAFIEQCQPFQNQAPDRHILWVLHELSNSEKHQKLPLLEIFREVENTTLSQFGGAEIVSVKYGKPGPLKSGAEIARWSVNVAAEGQVKVDFQITRDIVIDATRPPVLQGSPLCVTLRTLGDATSAVIRDMRAIHAAPPSPNSPATPPDSPQNSAGPLPGP